MPGHYLEQIDLPSAYLVLCGWKSSPAEAPTFAGRRIVFASLSIGYRLGRFSRNCDYYRKFHSFGQLKTLGTGGEAP
jgi:hypothetical protein